MKIEVTQEDIDKGERGSCSGCPVALAMKRALGVQTLLVEDDAAWTNMEEYLLPDPVPDFIGDFDTGEPVKPFTFELPI